MEEKICGIEGGNMIVYGPVASWRLGRSLGIDLINSAKTCSFDCIYCQLGRTVHLTAERKKFVEDEHIMKEIDSLPPLEADVVTFSGTGEPTLAENLGMAAEYVKKLNLPTAILTNSSLFWREDVRKDLKKIDWIIAKLDAPDEKIFRKINRPHESIDFDEMIEGMKKVARNAKKFSLQMMFVKENVFHAREMAELAKEIKAHEIQLNTPLRKSPVKPLSEEDMEKIAEYFEGMNVKEVYSSSPPEAKPIDYMEVLRRRPE